MADKAFSWIKMARFAHTPELELGWHTLCNKWPAGPSVLMQILVQLDGREKGVVRLCGLSNTRVTTVCAICEHLVSSGYVSSMEAVNTECGLSTYLVTLSNLLIFPTGSAQEKRTTEKRTTEEIPLQQRTSECDPLAEVTAEVTAEDAVEGGISVEGKCNTAADEHSNSSSDSAYRLDGLINLWDKEISKLTEGQRLTALKHTYIQLKGGMDLDEYEKWFHNAMRFLKAHKGLRERNLANWVQRGHLFKSTPDLEHHFKTANRSGLGPVAKEYQRSTTPRRPEIVIDLDPIFEEVTSSDGGPTLQQAIKEAENEMR